MKSTASKEDLLPSLKSIDFFLFKHACLWQYSLITRENDWYSVYINHKTFVIILKPSIPKQVIFGAVNGKVKLCLMLGKTFEFSIVTEEKIKLMKNKFK